MRLLVRLKGSNVNAVVNARRHHPPIEGERHHSVRRVDVDGDFLAMDDGGIGAGWLLKMHDGCLL